MAKVLLCSASPRRRELLKKVVVEFDVASSGAEESSPYVRPHLRVMDLALKKSLGLGEDPRIVICSDTLVYKKGKYYGKPKDKADAFLMLKELSGDWHSVYTGVCLKKGEETVLFYDRADVLFNKLSDREIKLYLERFAPYDKAGAYGIQDGVVVKKYLGSFDTIMGLPTEKLKVHLEKMGVKDVYK